MGGRNIVYWDRVRSPRAVSALVVATALGAGLLPKMPGTWGTMIAIPLAYATRDWDPAPRFALWAGLLALGTWSAKVFDEIMKTGDNQCIVIDEVVGLGITSWTLGGASNSVWGWIAAFALFRFFDVLKLPPVRQLDSWSKIQSRAGTTLASWWGGFGVMADDVLAGFQGLFVIFLLQRLGILP